MATAKATLSDYRQSPRKVRLVADYMRGKHVDAALDGLKFLDKRASAPLRKLLESAVANAKNLDIDEANLYVQAITVDGGPILYRRRPAPHGRANPIRKKTSKVTIVLGEKERKAKKGKVAKKEAEAAPAEKPARKAKAKAKKEE